MIHAKNGRTLWETDSAGKKRDHADFSTKVLFSKWMMSIVDENIREELMIEEDLNVPKKKKKKKHLKEKKIPPIGT